MTLHFKIDCNPPKSTHQGSMRIMKRHDGTRFVGKFHDSKGRQTMDMLLTLLAPHRPAQAMEGPLTLTVLWSYPWRKTEKKAYLSQGFRPCDTYPDCDNLAKMLCDAMTKLAFWHDDGQVSSLCIQKEWSAKPGITITVGDMMGMP